MNKNPTVAVVILSWNGAKFLQQFLPSVVASTYSNVVMYVADNASTDNSLAILAKNFPTVKVIALKENLGFTGGYNAALKQVKSDYYVLLNQDVEVEPDWIEPVIQLMESSADIAACQPKIKAFHNKDHFEYAGAAGGYIDRYGYPFCRGRIFETVEKDHGQYDDARQIFWATGACLFIKSTLYHKLGGLDERLFAHMEEIDLCWRLQNKGYKIMYCPKSVVYHVGGGSLPQGSPRKTYLNFRNNLIIIHKNTPTPEAVYLIISRLILDHVAAYTILFKGNWRTFLAIGKAHRHYVGGVFKWHHIKNNAYLKSLNGVYPKNIVWQYFVKKKRFFSKLDILQNTR